MEREGRGRTYARPSRNWGLKMIILGIDPGLSGGLCLLKGVAGQKPEIVDCVDVPTTGDGSKRRVDVHAVLSFIQQAGPPDKAFIERAQAMPDQGSSSGFNYGRAVGALEACVVGLDVPLQVIESTAWKKAHGLIKREKEDSRQRAIMLFPTAHGFFARKKDHNRAEAALIAHFGRAISL